MSHKTPLKKITAILAISALLAALAACAPQPSGGNVTQAGASDSSEAGAADSTMQMDWTWAPDSDCAACHAQEAASQDDASSPASFHAATPCASCHDDEEGLASAHNGVSAGDATPGKLAETSMGEQVCLGCHESYDELAAKTKGSESLIDADGTVVNPHELPENADHESLRCSTCHKLHGDEDAGKRAKQICLSCHHSDVFECNTCHTA